MKTIRILFSRHDVSGESQDKILACGCSIWRGKRRIGEACETRFPRSREEALKDALFDCRENRRLRRKYSGA